MPKLRFSLKWLLIVFVVLSVVLFLFVRPTVLAHRFVNSINSGELTELYSLKSKPHTFKEDLYHMEYFGFAPINIRAELKPRTWGDVFKMQRRISIYITSLTQGVSISAGTGEYYLIAGIRGVERAKSEWQRYSSR